MRVILRGIQFYINSKIYIYIFYFKHGQTFSSRKRKKKKQVWLFSSNMKNICTVDSNVQHLAENTGFPIIKSLLMEMPPGGNETTTFIYFIILKKENKITVACMHASSLGSVQKTQSQRSFIPLILLKKILPLLILELFLHKGYALQLLFHYYASRIRTSA